MYCKIDIQCDNDNVSKNVWLKSVPPNPDPDQIIYDCYVQICGCGDSLVTMGTWKAQVSMWLMQASLHWLLSVELTLRIIAGWFFVDCVVVSRSQLLCFIVVWTSECRANFQYYCLNTVASSKLVVLTVKCWIMVTATVTAAVIPEISTITTTNTAWALTESEIIT